MAGYVMHKIFGIKETEMELATNPPTCKFSTLKNQQNISLEIMLQE